MGEGGGDGGGRADGSGPCGGEDGTGRSCGGIPYRCRRESVSGALEPVIVSSIELTKLNGKEAAHSGGEYALHIASCVATLVS